MKKTSADRGNRRSGPGAARGTGGPGGAADSRSGGDSGAKTTKRPRKKLSEYGRQLQEKQRIKRMYGMREKQFYNFFKRGVRMEGAPGENLLSLLERRIDNVLYRLKMSVNRSQARQVIVHGHVRVNGRVVQAPSFSVSPGDIISLRPQVESKEAFLAQVIDKRLKLSIRVPEWLQLDVDERMGRVLRVPERADVQIPVEEHLIVELYSK